MQRGQNDETLVLLTLAGDQSAYEQLVRKYERAVIASARSVTGNLYLAEDVAQDAFITGWMKLEALKDPAKYGAWVCRIAKNCVRNTVLRFENYLDLEVVENVRLADTEKDDPAELYLRNEQKSELQQCIDRLSDRVQTVIKLHYFEGLSVTEIAKRMSITEGTVKWQLHEGRKKIRKDLCAMNEQMNDELVVRVMKKVAELKAFERMNSKVGFEKVYKDVLKEVEELPESKEKQSALASVLMYGWWWVPGEKNDDLLARIKKAAEVGRNEEVMIFVCAKEDGKWWGSSGIRFILDKQIPYLQAQGFKTAEGAEWLEVAVRYFRAEEMGYAERDAEKGREALEKAMALLPENHRLHGFARCVGYCEDYFDKELKEKPERAYRVTYDAFLLEKGQKGLCLSEKGGSAMGELCALDWESTDLLRSASAMDGCFTLSGLKVGERRTGSDGAVLTYCADDETVKTPAGIFENCRRWQVESDGRIFLCWYKDGVGLVKYSHRRSGWSGGQVLVDYQAEGDGLIPFKKGNYWKYSSEKGGETLLSDVVIFVASVKDDQAVLGQIGRTVRFGYDESSWLDTMLEMRNEYCAGNELVDVTAVMERAKGLAVTDMEKAHTAAACSVMERILRTDAHINPKRTASGHWNFFQRHVVHSTEGETKWTDHDTLFNFEWKHYDGKAALPVINSDIFGILTDTTGCIWSEKWVDGYKETRELMRYGERFLTDISVF
ncbi:MAG: sigma-70 family RNA polymerase sigma factor, partial [Clostridia bacterium]|nr:sigma-70 family RNA polymerase sigma factor [Clostridia bacterium]